MPVSPRRALVAASSFPFCFMPLTSGTGIPTDAVTWHCGLGRLAAFPADGHDTPGQGPVGQLCNGLWPDPMQMLP